jgi:hypothetical protein
MLPLSYAYVPRGVVRYGLNYGRRDGTHVNGSTGRNLNEAAPIVS